MKRSLVTALVAVFLSIAVSGCYTKLKSPGPRTGETYYYDDYDYWYSSPYFYHYGWYSPYFYGYPLYYGYFYAPWWYDPWYYYGDGGYYDGRTPSRKEIRRRNPGDDLPPVPGGSYSPSPPSQGSGSSSQPPASGDKQRQGNDNGNSSGKATRGRR
jgi:hypothetical protein